jgi:septum formation protein
MSSQSKTRTSPQLILGSSSPARRLLLERLKIPFSVATPDIDETPLKNELAEDLVVRLAKEKAQKIAIQFPNTVIIGCDQVGTLNNTIITKPLTHANAVTQLQHASGKNIRFLTGMCVLDTRTNHLQIATETYDVQFRELSLPLIESYLQKEKPYACAGSFHIEGLGIALVEKLAGADYTALIGLPLIRLTSMLANIPQMNVLVR